MKCLLREVHVSVNAGIVFGGYGGGRLGRSCFGDAEKVEEAMRRIELFSIKGRLRRPVGL